MRLLFAIAVVIGSSLSSGIGADAPFRIISFSGSYPIIKCEIENSSDRTIVIKKVSAGCSCKSISVDKKVMHPLERSIVTFTSDQEDISDSTPNRFVILTEDTQSPAVVIDTQNKGISLLK